MIAYPKNPHIKNTKTVAVYLFFLRRRWRILAKAMELLLNCQISCDLPDRLFIPHPMGIVVDTHCVLGNNVVLLQQVTLGVVGPYYHSHLDPKTCDPILEEGVYVGPGAKILGHITIGKWSVIGANAVVTINIPPYSIVVGHNRILSRKSIEL
jgi:serine O-acetyltransferase